MNNEEINTNHLFSWRIAILYAIIAAIFAVTGIVTLAVSRGRHLAWPVFLAIAALSAAPPF